MNRQNINPRRLFCCIACNYRLAKENQNALKVLMERHFTMIHIARGKGKKIRKLKKCFTLEQWTEFKNVAASFLGTQIPIVHPRFGQRTIINLQEACIDEVIGILNPGEKLEISGQKLQKDRIENLIDDIVCYSIRSTTIVDDGIINCMEFGLIIDLENHVVERVFPSNNSAGVDSDIALFWYEGLQTFVDTKENIKLAMEDFNCNPAKLSIIAIKDIIKVQSSVDDMQLASISQWIDFFKGLTLNQNVWIIIGILTGEGYDLEHGFTYPDNLIDMNHDMTHDNIKVIRYRSSGNNEAVELMDYVQDNLQYHDCALQ